MLDRGRLVRRARHQDHQFRARVRRKFNVVAQRSVERLRIIGELFSAFRIRAQPGVAVGLLAGKEMRVAGAVRCNRECRSGGEGANPERARLFIEVPRESIPAPPVATPETVGMERRGGDRLPAPRSLGKFYPDRERIFVHLKKGAGNANSAFFKSVGKNVFRVMWRRKLTRTEIRRAQQSALPNAKSKGKLRGVDPIVAVIEIPSRPS